MVIRLYIVICKRGLMLQKAIFKRLIIRKKSFEIEMFLNPLSWLLKGQLLHYRAIQGLSEGLICILNSETVREKIIILLASNEKRTKVINRHGMKINTQIETGK
jgi:hypothetical protein